MRSFGRLIEYFISCCSVNIFLHQTNSLMHKNMKNFLSSLFIPAIIFFICNGALAQINFSSLPVWQAASGSYPTGLGWADLNGDGHLDVVVSNGLDVSNAPIVAFYNNGGALPSTPGWTSSELAPHDCIYLGDFNQDGKPDLAVSKLGITSTGLPPLHHTIYFNNGTGLSTSPGWHSPLGNGFSCTGGDVDGDGDIDLVFGQGDWLSNHLQKTKLFINNNGTFDTIPGWESDSAWFVDEVVLADVDNDGDLDLAIGNERIVGNAGIAIFYNNGGVLETTPSWHTDSIIGGRQMDFGDMDHDGDLDLAVASPTQRFYVFRNNNGVLETTPCWSSPDVSEPSTVSWADTDGDGDLELAAGSWFSPLLIFDNTGSIPEETPSWSVPNGQGTQQVTWADYDEDDLHDTTFTATGNGIRKLFYLGIKHIQKIATISVAGMPVPIDQYCHDLPEGWVSLATAPPAGDLLTVSYTFSNDLDLTVTNWTKVKIYENLNVVTCTSELKKKESRTELSQNHPNPFCGSTVIDFSLAKSCFVTMKIYDPMGKEISALIRETRPAGNQSVVFDGGGLSEGVYTCLLRTDDCIRTRKLVLVKD